MASFDISGKVAIVTGGASGIGLVFATELLSKGARGVTLVDINSDLGYNVVDKLVTKFGKNKALFVKTDVADYEQFEDVFKKTISMYNNVDILVNNAGIFNGALWQREFEVNVNGTVNGILLGLEKYIPKYKTGTDGLIVNLSSVTGILPFGSCPTYVGTKFAIHGMTLSWGLPAHFDRTKIRVVGICPGATTTELFNSMADNMLGPFYKELLDGEVGAVVNQSPTSLVIYSDFDTVSQLLGICVGVGSDNFRVSGSIPPKRELRAQVITDTEEIAPHLIKIIEKAPSGTIWILEGGEAPYQ